MKLTLLVLFVVVCVCCVQCGIFRRSNSRKDETNQQIGITESVHRALSQIFKVNRTDGEQKLMTKGRQKQEHPFRLDEEEEKEEKEKQNYKDGCPEDWIQVNISDTMWCLIIDQEEMHNHESALKGCEELGGRMLQLSTIGMDPNTAAENVDEKGGNEIKWAGFWVNNPPKSNEDTENCTAVSVYITEAVSERNTTIWVDVEEMDCEERFGIACEIEYILPEPEEKERNEDEEIQNRNSTTDGPRQTQTETSQG